MALPFLGDRKLFEQLPQAALLLDLQGQVLAANTQACRLLATDEKGLLGRHADEATGFSVLAESCPLEEVIQHGRGLHHLEIEGRSEGLPLVVVEALAEPLIAEVGLYFDPFFHPGRGRPR